MQKFSSSLVLCFLYINSIFALDSADRTAIQEIIKNYTIAWNDHACKGFGDDFAVDADFVNIFGMHFSGKEEIEIRHIKILQTFLKDSKLQILNTTLREVQPGLVIGIIKWKADGFKQPGSDMNLPGVSREGIFTQVFIKHDHRWEITASQNTLIPK